ncbi:2-succinyl-6-hydroxy-2,4-cyclohexadiene-1-carboxylate synthase [Anaerobacillus sp. 1_MG-2023]|uniref:2-succinyl-6-hydroxy-2, 4-cyclohexadiene-1-carboxylate synthase n=1 Tax=Bacillales TaxID=1385 RepID=UPI0026E21A4B|nr:2-succinyl-6-hydroxy-2,4-cyclohexadiene-1-carboxylate synthase [Anaerobacillus sp. 1_MG-2023]MDO6658031.1 2-succinyl-6-hydroxy-2,4-cyclohexadiene-1-carboxylate synthase [Anaerobacillus sp. 1_MG-2023]
MIYTVGGQPFYVEIVGEGEPLLLLHGFTGSSENWSSFMKRWSRLYKVIAIDFIGHGESAKPNDASQYTMESMGSYLKQLLNLLGIDQLHLLGYSMGGRFALSFAVQYPSLIKTLILESSSPGLFTEDQRRERVQKDHALARRIQKEGIEDFVTFWESLPLFSSQKKLSPSIQSEIRKQRLSNTEIGLANSLIGMGTGAQASYWSVLEEITVPVLLIVGEYDQKFISIGKQMEKKLPQADFVQIIGAGHTIHVEEPEIFDKMVVAFLKKHADSNL